MQELKNILFFSSDEPEDSKSNRYHVAKALSEQFKVIYVYRQYLSILSILKKPSRLTNMFFEQSNISEKKNIIFITPPLCLPGKSNFIKAINTFFISYYLKKILKKFNIVNYLTWVVTPFQLELIKKFPGKFSVYHCHDGYAYYPDANSHVILRRENELKKTVDLIFYASKFLFEKGGYANKSHYIGHGFDPIFLNYNHYTIPEDMRIIPKPIIGFHGIFSFHSDEQLLEFLIKEHPDISFVFVGPVYLEEAKILSEYDNYFFLGQKKLEELPGYLNCFDLSILPYKKIPMTNACSPLKLYEYLACGLPILSVDIPGVHVHKDYIYIAENKEEFSSLIPELLSRKHDYNRQKDYAKQHLWPKKVDLMIKTIRKKYRT